MNWYRSFNILITVLNIIYPENIVEKESFICLIGGAGTRRNIHKKRKEKENLFEEKGIRFFKYYKQFYFVFFSFSCPWIGVILRKPLYDFTGAQCRREENIWHTSNLLKFLAIHGFNKYKLMMKRWVFLCSMQAPSISHFSHFIPVFQSTLPAILNYFRQMSFSRNSNIPYGMCT